MFWFLPILRPAPPPPRGGGGAQTPLGRPLGGLLPPVYHTSFEKAIPQTLRIPYDFPTISIRFSYSETYALLPILT